MKRKGGRVLGPTSTVAQFLSFIFVGVKMSMLGVLPFLNVLWRRESSVLGMVLGVWRFIQPVYEVLRIVNRTDV